MADKNRDVPCVLLIDDDDFVAVSLRQYLASHGCDVDVAYDRPSAGHLLAARSYEVVVLDPYMTGEAGRGDATLLDTVRSQQPRARVILLSAYTSEALLASGVVHQTVAVLTKPQPVTVLTQLVISALKSQMNMENPS